MPSARKNTSFKVKEMFNAFVLFLEKGEKAVRETYPQHLHFVQSNAKRSYQQVKDDLLRLEYHQI